MIWHIKVYMWSTQIAQYSFVKFKLKNIYVSINVWNLKMIYLNYVFK